MPRFSCLIQFERKDGRAGRFVDAVTAWDIDHARVLMRQHFDAKHPDAINVLMVSITQTREPVE